MKMLRLPFSRRWIIATLLVIAAMGVLIRLGIWQLDRLDKRRAFNQRVLAQTGQPMLDLNQHLDAGIAGMEYRQARVSGEYDHSQQIALRNQYWENQWGVHLVTPLKIAGSEQYIYIDRGWIPSQDFQSGDWSAYDEYGMIEVNGVIRASQDKADFGSRGDSTPAPDQAPLLAWNFVNIEALQNQTDHNLLPAYIQQAPESTPGGPPYRSLPDVEITEGPHLGYAIQWFTFAGVLVLGYPFFIRWQEANRDKKSGEKLESNNQSNNVKEPNLL